jgi:hypothetical protein
MWNIFTTVFTCVEAATVLPIGLLALFFNKGLTFKFLPYLSGILCQIAFLQ